MKLELSLAICGSKNSHFEVGLDLLIINSELSIMHQNSIKERNQSIIPWHNLTKSKHSFELCYPPSLLISLSLCFWFSISICSMSQNLSFLKAVLWICPWTYLVWVVCPVSGCVCLWQLSLRECFHLFVTEWKVMILSRNF